jgi:hypothetical protein
MPSAYSPLARLPHDQLGLEDDLLVCVGFGPVGLVEQERRGGLAEALAGLAPTGRIGPINMAEIGTSLSQSAAIR